jgi:hypothetical protein
MDDQDATEFMDDDSNDANSPAAENDQTTYEDLAAGPSVEPVEVGNTRTLGQPLSDFLMTLEDYTPTVSEFKQSIIFSSLHVNVINLCSRSLMLLLALTLPHLVLKLQTRECKSSRICLLYSAFAITTSCLLQCPSGVYCCSKVHF